MPSVYKFLAEKARREGSWLEITSTLGSVFLAEPLKKGKSFRVLDVASAEIRQGPIRFVDDAKDASPMAENSVLLADAWEIAMSSVKVVDPKHALAALTPVP